MLLNKPVSLVYIEVKREIFNRKPISTAQALPSMER
jgi:hypothetical protein